VQDTSGGYPWAVRNAREAEPKPPALQPAVASDRFTDNGDGTMTDKVTGLTWEKKPGGGDKSTAYGGSMEWNVARDYADRLSLAGYDDWRLPTLQELESLAKDAKGRLAKWLSSQGFIEVKAKFYYTGTMSWGLSWGKAVSLYSLNVQDTSGGYPWALRDAVRSGPQPSAASDRFADNGNGTMTDKVTSLTWEKKPGGGNLGRDFSGFLSWNKARDYADRLSLGGYTDWRLPSLQEMEILAQDAEGNPAQWLASQGFSEVRVKPYLTQSASGMGASALNFFDESVQELSRSATDCYVWAVRGGAAP
jgi:hypothetical protein